LVYQQIQHVKNRDLGYDKNQLLVMRANDKVIQKFSVIKKDLINTGAVKNTALCNSVVLSGGSNRTGLKWDSAEPTEDILISLRHVSSEFIQTIGMEIVEGRNFSTIMIQDSTNVLITQSFADLMGKGSALGKKVIIDEKAYQVKGVVKNYLYGDMYGTSDPVLFFNNTNYGNFLYVKIEDEISAALAISKIKTVMKKHNPVFPFDYNFVDNIFDAKFKNEQLISKLSQLFALLAILISCLGLFGLAAYTVERRSKEIGIRKVLGASVSGVVKLLSKNFLKLVGISILIAVPIAWYAMENWLQDYAYRIEINLWIFIISGGVALLIAMLTVSFQAIKAALANPVDSLKTE
jgi:ABC-type antimicrobial peptide transport system permease subunit